MCQQAKAELVGGPIHEVNLFSKLSHPYRLFRRTAFGIHAQLPCFLDKARRWKKMASQNKPKSLHRTRPLKTTIGSESKRIKHWRRRKHCASLFVDCHRWQILATLDQNLASAFFKAILCKFSSLLQRPDTRMVVGTMVWDLLTGNLVQKGSVSTSPLATQIPRTQMTPPLFKPQPAKAWG